MNLALAYGNLMRVIFERGLAYIWVSHSAMVGLWELIWWESWQIQYRWVCHIGVVGSWGLIGSILMRGLAEDRKVCHGSSSTPSIVDIDYILGSAVECPQPVKLTHILPPSVFHQILEFAIFLVLFQALEKNCTCKVVSILVMSDMKERFYIVLIFLHN